MTPTPARVRPAAPARRAWTDARGPRFPSLGAANAASRVLIGLLFAAVLASCGSPADRPMAGSPAAGEGAGERPPRFFDTIIITPDGDTRHVVGVHFDPATGLSFTAVGQLGEGDPLPNPRDVLARVDSPDVTISTDSFLSLSERVAEATADDPPPQRYGYAYSGGQLRLFFDRSATVGGVVLLGGLVTLALGGLVATAVLLGRLRREQARRRALVLTQEQRVDARERERSRIARDIHDGPIQDLHALRMVASAEVAAGADAGAVVDGRLREISGELRAIAEGLRPPSLGRFGLAAALEAHVARLQGRRPDVHITARLDEDAVADGDPDRPHLDERARVSLFRVAQEALNNALEHAGARSVTLTLAFLPDPRRPAEILLEVRDDGRGMGGVASAEPSALVEAGHFGLAGMYERAELLGGRLTVGPCPAGARGGADGPEDARANGVPTNGHRAKGPHANGPRAAGEQGVRGTCLRLTAPWSRTAARASAGAVAEVARRGR